MKVFRIKDVPVEPADSPLFTGGEVTRQQMVTTDIGKNFTFNIVNFGTGARNYFHTHTSDQVLLITEGTGIVATENEEQVVSQGDVVHVPAGEKHWHGATPNTSMSHVTVTSVDSKTTQLEP